MVLFSQNFKFLIGDTMGPAGQLIQRGWTQHTHARDSNGAQVNATDPTAVCWCIYGALHKIYPNALEYCLAHNKIEDVIDTPLLAVWNDAPHRTHEQVIEVFRKAAI